MHIAQLETMALLLALILLAFDATADERTCSRNRIPLENQPPSFAPYLSMQDTTDAKVLYERGHLKPLGYHRPPDRVVETLPYMIDPEDFHSHYVLKHKPVVIKDYVKHWRATTLWTDEHLSARYGHVKMMLETKDDDKYHPLPARPLDKFLANYKTSNLYLVDETLPEMRRDITLPTCLRCEEMTDRLFLSSFWMSNGGTSSKTHIDTNENLLCVIHGSKTLLLFSPFESHSLYADDSIILGVSPVDPTRVDFDAYPRAMDLRYELAFVDAGDLIYIPQFWWHHVISHSGRQQAVSLWWKSHPPKRPLGAGAFLPLGREHGSYSYVDTLVYYEQWVLNMSDAAPPLKCQSQSVPMSSFRWETDRDAESERTKSYGYDDEEAKGETWEQWLQEGGDESENVEVRLR